MRRFKLEDPIPSIEPIDVSFDEDVDGTDIEVAHMRAEMLFHEASRKFEQVVGHYQKLLENNFLAANVSSDNVKNLIASNESLEVHCESIQDIIVTIIKALMDFIKKTWGWFLSFKKIINMYFMTNHKKVLEAKKWLEAFERARIDAGGLANVIDIDNFKKETITWRIRKDRVDGCLKLADVHIDVTEYIGDPENNNIPKLKKLETNTGPLSFRKFLGLTLATNYDKPLAEPRITAFPPASLYDVEHGHTYDILVLSDDNLTMPAFFTDIFNLEAIVKNSVDLQRNLDMIERSYNVIGEGINKAQKNPEFTDAAVGLEQAHAWTIAKHHVKKSKALIEAFVKLCDIELKQRLELINQLRKHCTVVISH